MYTLLYLQWITNKDLSYSTGNSAQCYMPAWMGVGVWGRTDTCTWMAEFLHCLPETITTLLFGYTPIQNKKSKVWKKKQNPQTNSKDKVAQQAEHWHLATVEEVSFYSHFLSFFPTHCCGLWSPHQSKAKQSKVRRTTCHVPSHSLWHTVWKPWQPPWRKVWCSQLQELGHPLGLTELSTSRALCLWNKSW